MTGSIASARSPSEFSPAFIPSIAVVVLAWFTLIVVLGAASVFQEPPSRPPAAVLVALIVPPLIFLMLLRAAPGFRRQVLSISPVWLSAVQGLRIIGASFLVLYSFGHLPGLVAHPAGWGDMTVALLAPFMAVRLARQPSFLTSPWYWRFHALGMLDFASAVGTALLARGSEGTVTTQVLGDLPLVLIPAFAVPLWICLHLTAFTQIREARRAETA